MAAAASVDVDTGESAWPIQVTEREVLDARVEQVENDGGDHRGRHRGRSRAREESDGQQSRAGNLRGSSGQGPELRWAWKEAKELGHDIRGEAVDVLDFVEAMVHHERARAEADSRDAEVDDGLHNLRLLLICVRENHRGATGTAGDDGLQGRGLGCEEGDARGSENGQKEHAQHDIGRCSRGWPGVREESEEECVAGHLQPTATHLREMRNSS